ncbi:MAG: YIP1 family protein [Candidatus Pristimantibacillus lignocellulolyticus]|uniref:YIP1 family protein n=1 Tax=Candidatus Pristimantibacillus lignocellulolyticus TaxID=2994561 RepID=A0A9J6Z8Q0_9BACL|nr:MAG: YIP1 family protein [Candidatus Pristimantibacillus lignocellulolyticus]
MNPFVMMHRIIFKPFDFFEDIQSPGIIRIRQAIVLVLCAYIARIISIYSLGFAYETREAYQISILQEAIWILVPWLTWCIAHWAVSAILDGEGKFKEIVYGSAFALVPYIVFIIPVTLLSQILALDESGMINFFTFVIYAWVIWLFILKVKILHNFDLPKTLFIAFLSIVAVFILWFICVLLFGLANQFLNFLLDMVKELRLRG